MFISSLCFGESYAAEITLVCKGTRNFYSSYIGSREFPDSIEVRFDDAINKVTYVDPPRVFGCYGTETEYERSCDCSVSNTDIICISKSKIKDGSFQSDQTIDVNRLTGVLSFSEITSGRSSDEKSGKYFLRQSGKLQCESFTKKKF
jgi:hypothetical protein